MLKWILIVWGIGLFIAWCMVRVAALADQDTERMMDDIDREPTTFV